MLRRYDVIIKNPVTGREEIRNSTMGLEYRASGLDPFTRYKTTVAYVNSVDTGPKSSEYSFTTEEAGQLYNQN